MKKREERQTRTLGFIEHRWVDFYVGEKSDRGARDWSKEGEKQIRGVYDCMESAKGFNGHFPPCFLSISVDVHTRAEDFQN